MVEGNSRKNVFYNSTLELVINTREFDSNGVKHFIRCFFARTDHTGKIFVYKHCFCYLNVQNV